MSTKPMGSATGWTLIFLLIGMIGFVVNGLVRHNWMLWATGALCAWLFIQILSKES
jgi:hypothetical protein